MFTLDFSDRRPLYEQIREKIKGLIVSGALSEGERIPSVRELAGQLSINPNTIQKAYRELESEGYIYSVRGRGSFVAAAAVGNAENELLGNLGSLLTELRVLNIPRSTIEEIIDKIYKE